MQRLCDGIGSPSREEYERMRGHRPLYREPIFGVLIAGIARQVLALAQHEHTTPAGAVQPFVCENDGLIRRSAVRVPAARAHHGCRIP